MKQVIIIFALFFVFALKTHAVIGVGTMGPFSGTYQAEVDGNEGTESFLQIHPYLSVNHRWKLSEMNSFIPELGYVFPKSSSEKDDASKRSLVFLLLNMGTRILPTVILKYGIGTFRTNIYMDGGAIEIPNGSSTLTAYMPTESITSYNSTINLGLEYMLNSEMALKTEAYIWNILDSPSRKWNLAIAFNFYGGFLGS
jgi:hypothetical protein